jgi:predicted nucleic acid-binding protein
LDPARPARRLILDSNILIALFQDEQPSLFEKLATWKQSHDMFINLVIYAEVAPSFSQHDALRLALDGLNLQIVPFTETDAYRAGKAFAEYRRKGLSRTTILPDFLIGAQAATRGWPIVTRDRKGFESYFPEVELIDPHKADHD